MNNKESNGINRGLIAVCGFQETQLLISESRHTHYLNTLSIVVDNRDNVSHITTLTS
jgi:hypothetical protein